MTRFEILISFVSVAYACQLAKVSACIAKYITTITEMRFTFQDFQLLLLKFGKGRCFLTIWAKTETLSGIVYFSRIQKL